MKAREHGPTTVSVLTARGMAAIASVALAGPDAAAILGKILRMGGTEARSGSDGMRNGGRHHVAAGARFCPGAVLHGSIIDGETAVDEVVVGCEGEDHFVIHCHGNPLLVEQIVQLCRRRGAALVSAEQFADALYRTRSDTLIEAEARRAMQTCATLTGAKIIANQLTYGLLPTVRRWLEAFDEMTLQELWAQCHQVLRKTSRAGFFINRCRIVLIGPPNSGKSTLLNQLAGREEAIVTETAGTTRDWVKITCRVGPLLADIYDTAGLDEVLTRGRDVDKAAQDATMELIRAADMNLFVYDVTAEQAAQSLLFSLGGFKGIIVANKCDLLSARQREHLYSKYVRLCAATGDGLEQLTQTLLKALRVTDFNPRTPVCFTDRQLLTLRQLLRTKDKPAARQHLESLLYGKASV